MSDEAIVILIKILKEIDSRLKDIDEQRFWECDKTLHNYITDLRTELLGEIR